MSSKSRQCRQFGKAVHNMSISKRIDNGSKFPEHFKKKTLRTSSSLQFGLREESGFTRALMGVMFSIYPRFVLSAHKPNFPGTNCEAESRQIWNLEQAPIFSKTQIGELASFCIKLTNIIGHAPREIALPVDYKCNECSFKLISSQQSRSNNVRKINNNKPPQASQNQYNTTSNRDQNHRDSKLRLLRDLRTHIGCQQSSIYTLRYSNDFHFNFSRCICSWTRKWMPIENFCSRMSSF